MDTWILVIDDDPGTREALTEILVRAGYRVSAWADAAPLQGAGLERPYQVAVVDYHLPHGDGLQVASRLKALQPDCRVILTSSEFPGNSEPSPLMSVVDRFLAKPFSKDVILDAVASWCRPATS